MRRKPSRWSVVPTDLLQECVSLMRRAKAKRLDRLDSDGLAAMANVLESVSTRRAFQDVTLRDGRSFSRIVAAPRV